MNSFKKFLRSNLHIFIEKLEVDYIIQQMLFMWYCSQTEYVMSSVNKYTH